MTPDQRLMEALRFYADEWNWQPDGYAMGINNSRVLRPSKVKDDGGAMARRVLRELDQ